nr:serine hydrolase domain-containing protein [Nocardioides daedukensis]
MPVHPVAPVTSRRLLAVLARAQVEGRVPSVVAGVIRDGSLVWHGGYGDVPGDPLEVQYKIGSITKTMTAVLVLQLVRDGQVALADPIGSVLGDIGHGDRTVRSLLAHNSGMQAEPSGPWWERSAGGTFAELAGANDGTSAPLPVGEQFHYSNLAYGLLGELVARLRGGTWWDAVQERILQPLGMTRTTYQAVAPHAQGASVHAFSNEVTAEPHPDTGAMAPAGQLWSTVADLTTYAAFLLEGHRDVLDKEHLEQAYIPQSGALGTGLDYSHGLGFQMFRGGSGTLIGHTGSMPGFVATCFIDRARRTGVVAFGNSMSGLPAVGLASGLLEDLESSEPTLPPPWRPSSPPPDLVRDVLGTWHWGPTLHQFSWEGEEVVVRKNQVVVHRYRVQGDRLVGTAGHHLGEALKVVRNDDGTVNHLDLSTFIFTRTPYDPAAPIPGGVPQ